MSNLTTAGVDNKFNVLINGTVVGQYDLLSTISNDNGNPIPFDLSFSFAPIFGPDFTGGAKYKKYIGAILENIKNINWPAVYIAGAI
jgi:hypothetical protein